MLPIFTSQNISWCPGSIWAPRWIVWDTWICVSTTWTLDRQVNLPTAVLGQLWQSEVWWPHILFITFRSKTLFDMPLKNLVNTCIFSVTSTSLRGFLIADCFTNGTHFMRCIVWSLHSYRLKNQTNSQRDTLLLMKMQTLDLYQLENKSYQSWCSTMLPRFIVSEKYLVPFLQGSITPGFKIKKT